MRVKEQQILGSKELGRPERRLSRRDPVRILAFCYYESNQLSLPAVVLDISNKGMAIRASEPVEVGQELRFRCQELAGGQSIELDGKVIWSDPQAHIGIHFIGESSQRWREWLTSKTGASISRCVGNLAPSFINRSA